ncbi:MAG: hypothetical protein AAGA23_03960 [Pseudomonadota bacterium]
MLRDGVIKRVRLLSLILGAAATLAAHAETDTQRHQHTLKARGIFVAGDATTALQHQVVQRHLATQIERQLLDADLESGARQEIAALWRSLAGLPAKTENTGKGQFNSIIRGRVGSASVQNLPYRVSLFSAIDGQQLRLVETDGVGRYEFRDLPAGDYFVFAEATGPDAPAATLFDGVNCYGGLSFGCLLVDGEPVNVAPGQTRSQIDLIIALGAMISGRVVDADSGLALELGFLEIFDANTGFRTDIVRTDQGGRYSIGGIDPGAYKLQAYTTDHKGHFYGAAEPCDERSNELNCQDLGSTITVDIGSLDEGFDFVLPQFGTLAGTVTEAETGFPVSSGRVLFLDENEDSLGSAEIDRLGRWQSVPMPDVLYRILIEPNDRRTYVYPDAPCPYLRPTCDLSAGQAVAAPLRARVNDLNSLSLVGASIAGSVAPELAGDAPVRMYTADGDLLGTTFSRDGAYRFTGLESGAYRLAAASGNGYRGEIYASVSCGIGLQDCADLTGASEISLQADEAVEGIDFVRVPAATLSGTLADEDGPLVRRVPIVIYDSQAQILERLFSSDSGTFSVTMPTGGPYYLAAGFPEANVRTIYPDIVCVAPSPCDPISGEGLFFGETGDTQVDFQIATGGTINGRITDQDGAPAFVQLELLNSAGDVITGSSGAVVSFEDLPPQTYFLRTVSPEYADELFDNVPCEGEISSCSLAAAVPLAIDFGTDLTDINIELESGAALDVRADSSIHETVELAFTLEIFDTLGNFVMSTPVAEGSASRIALSAGSYRLVAVPGAVYQGQVLGGADCVATCDPLTGTEVLVQNDNVTYVSFDLAPQRLLAGRVTNELTGQGVPAVLDVLGVGNQRMVQADESGAWRFVATEPGEYRVRTRQPGYANEIFDNIPCELCDFSDGAALDLAVPSVISNVNFALSPRTIISGTVRPEPNSPSGILARVSVLETDGSTVRAVATNSAGDYVIAGLAPGDYLLTAAAGRRQQMLWPDIPCPISCDFSQGIAVTVDTDNRENIDFVLPINGSLSGQIRATDTQSLVDGTVIVATEVNEGVTFQTVQGPTGFELENLSTGTYQIRFRSFPYFDRVYGGLECEKLPVDDCTPPAGLLVSIQPGAHVELPLQWLERRATIAGAVVAGDGITPVNSGHVGAWGSDGIELTRSDIVEGRYLIQGLPAGEYSLVARFNSPSPSIDQLYPATLCPGGLFEGCVPSDGEIVSVSQDERLEDVDFALSSSPRLTVFVRDRASDVSLDDAFVTLWDPPGNRVLQISPGEAGFPAPGTYVVGAELDGFQSVIWPDRDCPLNACDTSDAPIVELAPGGLRSLSISLPRTDGISGRVVNRIDGTPIAGAIVDVIWAKNPELVVASADTVANGGFSVPLWEDDFYLATDNGLNFVDLVFPDVLCFSGPVFAGECSLDNAGPVTVDGAVPVFVQLPLDPAFVIFRSGFE